MAGGQEFSFTVAAPFPPGQHLPECLESGVRGFGAWPCRELSGREFLGNTGTDSDKSQLGRMGWNSTLAPEKKEDHESAPDRNKRVSGDVDEIQDFHQETDNGRQGSGAGCQAG